MSRLVLSTTNINFNSFKSVMGTSTASLGTFDVSYKFPRGGLNNIAINPSYYNKTFYYFLSVSMRSSTHGDCNVDIPFFVSRQTPAADISNYIIDGSVYSTIRVRCYPTYPRVFEGWYPTLTDANNKTNRLSSTANTTFTLSNLASTLVQFWARTE